MCPPFGPVRRFGKRVAGGDDEAPVHPLTHL
jgi:hypothetical protein